MWDSKFVLRFAYAPPKRSSDGVQPKKGYSIGSIPNVIGTAAKVPSCLAPDRGADTFLELLNGLLQFNYGGHHAIWHRPGTAAHDLG